MNSKNGRKSQSSLLILLFIVTIFAILFVYFIFSSSTSQTRSVKGTGLMKISEYMDVIKGFSRYALLLSAHDATKQVAAMGGEISQSGITRNWICNGDVSPNVDSVRFFLSEETLKYLNSYLVNSTIKDLPVQDIKNYTCIDYDVNSGSVSSGLNDERFNIGAYGGTLSITLINDTVNSGNDVYEEIAQDRFWYMYRKFKEWSPEGATILTNGLCGCLGNICGCSVSPSYPGNCESCDSTCPGFQSCLEEAIASAKVKLEEIFNDPYIDCDASIIGCYHELEPCVGSPMCTGWLAPKCNNCGMKQPEELCSRTLFAQYSGDTKTIDNTLYFADCGGEVCKYWAETRGSMEATFSCKDNKYLLSVKGNRNLIFQVYAVVEMKQRNCESWGYCGESTAGSCTCGSGTWCTQCKEEPGIPAPPERPEPPETIPETTERPEPPEPNPEPPPPYNPG